MSAFREHETYVPVSLIDNPNLVPDEEKSMQVVKIPRLHCYRCVFTWTPVKSPVHMCPRCKSKLWDVPKIRPVKLGQGLGIEDILTPHLPEIRRLARKYGAERIKVFGSVRRHEATEESDVDLMVRWSKPVSLLDRAGLRLGIELVLGHPVDLVNEGGLHWAIAPQAESEAVTL
jgi:predicted nucleotidyltransferase